MVLQRTHTQSYVIARLGYFRTVSME